MSMAKKIDIFLLLPLVKVLMKYSLLKYFCGIASNKSNIISLTIFPVFSLLSGLSFISMQ